MDGYLSPKAILQAEIKPFCVSYNPLGPGFLKEMNETTNAIRFQFVLSAQIMSPSICFILQWNAVLSSDVFSSPESILDLSSCQHIPCLGPGSLPEHKSCPTKVESRHQQISPPWLEIFVLNIQDHIVGQKMCQGLPATTLNNQKEESSGQMK